MITRDVVRTQCRIKALYRSRGVLTMMSVYGKPQRETWLSKLPAPSRAAALLLYVELDELRELKKQAQGELRAESHSHPIAKVLETCPGLGEVRVAQLVPVVVAPERFRTAR
jgi:hypothetical protein